MPEESEAINYIKPLSCPYGLLYDTDSTYGLRDIKLDNPFFKIRQPLQSNVFVVGLTMKRITNGP